jgi:hypothetical protein
MAYVVARHDNPPPGATRLGPKSRPNGRPRVPGATRYEIRESVSTPAGPRARTLATFRVLTADVIAEAARRAQRPFDADKVGARAAALGVPRHEHGAAATASALLAQLRAGEKLPPALATQLRRALPSRRTETPDSLEGAVEWIGADDAARGSALRDLLDVASRIPTRPRPAALSFPRLSSNGQQ